MPQYDIKLADKTFTISGPLPFKQLRIVEPSMARINLMREETKATGKPFDENFYDEVANVLVTVIMPGDPTFTRGALDALPMTLDELMLAWTQVGLASGIFKPKTVEAKGGEGSSASPNLPAPLPTGA